ncbi:MAG: arginine--tRNA ligase [Deltaproteobacteria bacterium]|nr:arginine--tRNA ligase [Deltaproteobacteria bacterium]
MKEQLHEKLTASIRALLTEAGDDAEVPPFTLEVPRNTDHGDFACNAAMLLAKRLHKPPRDIATALIEQLGDAGGLLESAEIAGPGFVNLRLSASRWHDLVLQIIQEGTNYGGNATGAGKRVNVEFVSANPTGPLTVGHGRQAILGDVIARLLAASSWDVTREYYFNDGGRQMRVLGQSLKARYLEGLGKAAPPTPEMLDGSVEDWPERIDGLPVAFPNGGYQGNYLHEIAADLQAKRGDELVDEDADGFFRLEAQGRIFVEIRKTLDSLNIQFDEYYNESSLYDEGKLEETLGDLREKELVYEKDDATWLKATALGLDRDRVIVKRTGEPTYLFPDIAYHREKFRRGFDRIVDVQGADHIEQFPFVRLAVGQLGCDPERIELVMHQFVTITRGGEQVKQSTRRATYITIDDLVGEVGADVFRFFMIQRKAEGHLDFDLDLATSSDWKKNPAAYVQYAHARTCGIERKLEEQGKSMPETSEMDADRLVLPEEIELLKKLNEFPEVVARAAEGLAPHHVSYYLRELAGLWNPYIQDGSRHRILSDDEGLTAARIGLALAVRVVLCNGLKLLGVSAPEKM